MHVIYDQVETPRPRAYNKIFKLPKNMLYLLCSKTITFYLRRIKKSQNRSLKKEQKKGYQKLYTGSKHELDFEERL